jgi:hypothetical protein
MVMNLSSLQRTLSAIDRERGTKIPHQIFIDEELGAKKRSIKNSWPHSELTPLAGPKSKSGSRSFETATHPVRMLRAPGGRMFRARPEEKNFPFPG